MQGCSILLVDVCLGWDGVSIFGVFFCPLVLGDLRILVEASLLDCLSANRFEVEVRDPMAVPMNYLRGQSDCQHLLFCHSLLTYPQPSS